jgi:hypothetical protein
MFINEKKTALFFNKLFGLIIHGIFHSIIGGKGIGGVIGDLVDAESRLMLMGVKGIIKAGVLEVFVVSLLSSLILESLERKSKMPGF